MTKTKLLLASLLLVVGLGVTVPSALASLTPGASIFHVNQTIFTVRPNGLAEPLGPLALSWISGPGTIDGLETFTINFTQPIVGASGITSSLYADFCDDNGAHPTWDTLGPSSVAGEFCSVQKISASGSTLTLKNGTSPVGEFTSGTISIYGVRINANGLPGGTLINATIAAAFDTTDPIYFETKGAQSESGLSVGYVSEEGTLDVSGPVNCVTGAVISARSILTCVSAQRRDREDGTSFSILVNENWSGAWTSLSDEIYRGPYAPVDSNEVTNGSDISVTITGIPEGVTITPSTPFAPSGCTSCNETWGSFTPSSYTGTKWNDSVTFDFPLSTTVVTETESAIIQFWVSTPEGPFQPDNPPLAISVNLDPVNSSSSTITDNAAPTFYYATTGGVLAEEFPGSPIDVLTFIDCKTSLLFPYVTNYTTGPTGGALGNWDTFLNIANATSDPFKWGGAIPQNGACTFYVYDAGQIAGSATSQAPVEATPIVFTGPVQLSGGEFGTDLSSTPAAGVPGAYVIVSCDFLNATGYAQVVDNFGLGNWQIMSSYLAYVIPNPYKYWRATAGEGYGEFAITPVNGDELEHKLIHEMWKVFRVAEHI